MRTWMAAVTVWAILLSGMVGAAPDDVVTIYKKDNSWIQGVDLKREHIFGELYFLLREIGTNKIIRVRADDVFRVIDDEKKDAEQRIEFHYKQGLEAQKNNFWEIAAREFDKVLSIDPNHVNARNNLVIVRSKIGALPLTEEAAAGKTGTEAEKPEEAVQRLLGMRSDQLAFLRMVSEAHDVDFRALIIQAIDNWVRDYKDYKIGNPGKDLPPLRHPLIPED
jgi:hypothetical protein